MPEHAPHTRRAAMMVLALGAAALLGACGSSNATHTAISSKAKPPAATTSTTPSASTPAAAAAPPVGTVLLTVNQADGVCAQTFGAGWQTLSDIVVGGHLLEGGRVVLLCGDNADAQNPSPEEYVSYDLIARRVLWHANLTNLPEQQLKGPEAFFGNAHLFVVSQRTTPAQGLAAASTTYTLTARDLVTGATDWSTNLGTEDVSDGLDVVEGPSGIAAHPQSVVLSYHDGGVDAFDAATGQPLWRTPQGNNDISGADGDYVTDGISQAFTGNSNQQITGYDAATQRQVWQLNLPTACEVQDDTYIIGDIEWQMSPTCFEEYNVSSGALVAERQFPSGWQAVEARPGAVVEWDGSKLAFYNTSNMTTPVWSQPAGSTTPEAISSSHLLVDAPGDALILDNATGDIVAHVPASFDAGNVAEQNGNSPPVVDGLVESIAENGDTSVLQIDPPTAR